MQRNADGRQHFDDGRITALILNYQTAGDQNALAEIVELTQNRALALIRYQKTAQYRPEDELLSDINFKLIRTVSKFDPQKGTAFTYLSAVITSTLRTTVSLTRQYHERFCELDDVITNSLHAKAHDRAALDDIAAPGPLQRIAAKETSTFGPAGSFGVMAFLTPKALVE